MTKNILGYTWDDIQRAQMRGELAARVDTTRPGDYGSEPAGNGMVRMIPSGDIVTPEECMRRRAAQRR